MLNSLFEIEKLLPKLLNDKSEWKSLYVDYHKPFVKRLYRQFGENRIYLHKILPCEKEESLLHPHPWPSAMKVIQGTYQMGVGYSETNIEPVIASTLILPENSYYEMIEPHAWHYVRPLGQASYSLMITGTPWHRNSPKSTYPLRELDEAEKEDLFSVFMKKIKQ